MTAQQLKNSILQMAVQGKLIPQDPNDEPASVLLERIRAEKQALIKQGKIKKEKPLAPITEDEIPFEIPESWCWCRLNSIVSILGDGIHGTPEYSESGGYYFINGNNLSEGNIIIKDGTKKIDESQYLKYKKELNETTVFVSINGTIGNIAFYNNEPVILGKSACYFNLIIKDFKVYMYWLLKTDYFLKYAITNATGSTIKNVSLKTMNDFLVPLPPLAEQHRIVAKIEELLPYIEKYGAAETKLSALNTTFPEALKKSILQEAVQGKLVPQDPNDEPASVLLERIRTEKQALIKAGKIKKEKPLAPITEDEIPFEIPDSWMWVRMQDVVILNPKNTLDDNIETGFIPMPCVQDGFRNNHTFEVRKWGEIKKGFTHFANGDIGVAKITPCFQNRKSVVFRDLPNGYGAGTTELTVSRIIGDTLCHEYLLWFFKTDYFISNGVKSFTGTAGQQRIHKDYLGNCLFPLPPLAEQKRIAATIEEILPIISTI